MPLGTMTSPLLGDNQDCTGSEARPAFEPVLHDRCVLLRAAAVALAREVFASSATACAWLSTRSEVVVKEPDHDRGNSPHRL
jgi:hypothetical protein